MQTLLKHCKQQWANQILVVSYLSLVQINEVTKQQIPGNLFVFLFC